MERCEAGLKLRIVRGRGQENADAADALDLLRARRYSVGNPSRQIPQAPSGLKYAYSP
jgi:hypothetical protein